jgi:hypothetical protein
MDHHIDQILLMEREVQHSGVMEMEAEQIRAMLTSTLEKMLTEEHQILIRLYQKVLAFNLKIKMTRHQLIMHLVSITLLVLVTTIKNIITISNLKSISMETHHTGMMETVVELTNLMLITTLEQM